MICLGAPASEPWGKANFRWCQFGSWRFGEALPHGTAERTAAAETHRVDAPAVVARSSIQFHRLSRPLPSVEGDQTVPQASLDPFDDLGCGMSQRSTLAR